MGAKILTLSLPQQSCSLNDKSLTGHNIICQTKLVFEVSQLLEFHTLAIALFEVWIT
jgi:hypothetical protein